MISSITNHNDDLGIAQTGTWNYAMRSHDERDYHETGRLLPQKIRSPILV